MRLFEISLALNQKPIMVLGMNSTSNTKGEKIETLARVAHVGSACIGNMGFETPYVRFVLPDGRSAIWHSDSASKAANDLKDGTEVALTGFLYGNHLRRVSVGRGCLVWGIGQ